jgi:hypothetical protein
VRARARGIETVNVTVPDTRFIDTSWHPLIDGIPPDWATAWGQDQYGVWVEFTLDDVIQRLRWIPPGRFRMGSPESEHGGLAKYDIEREWFLREGPQHAVTLTRGYWLFDTPVTQALWEAVMGGNPSRFQSPDRPVEQVSWDDCQTFLEAINSRLPDLVLTLATEAQWEYACRADSEGAIYSGTFEILGERNALALDPIAWYGGNSGVDFELSKGEDSSNWSEKQYDHKQAGTHPVGKKQPNAWGLYDMLGNVWEWCADGLRDYAAEPVQDPVGPGEGGASRVFLPLGVPRRVRPGLPRQPPWLSLCPSSGLSQAGKPKQAVKASRGCGGVTAAK